MSEITYPAFMYYDGNNGNIEKFDTIENALSEAEYRWSVKNESERKSYTTNGGQFVVGFIDDNDDLINIVRDWSEEVE